MLRVMAIVISLFGMEASVLLADQTVSGDVFGTWYSGETITVVGDIRVPQGNKLLIEPDVDVLFTGLYKFTIQGLITAVGTQEQIIIFTRAYPNEDCRWRGFRFEGADDASIFEYCQVEWVWNQGSYADDWHGAVMAKNSSPTFRFCCFNDNISYRGGAITTESSCYSIIEFNHITRNQADSGGGIRVDWESDPLIRYNLIEENEASGSGGGIYVAAKGKAIIYGNVIRNNISSGLFGGGGVTLWSGTIYYGTFSHVFDNLIINNRATGSDIATGGGGIYSNYDTSRIYNNTILGNEAPRGGGLFVTTASFLPPLVTNSIFWANAAPTGSQIYADPVHGSTVTVTCCNVEGGYSGTGNIDTDPLFSDAAEGDFHLTWDSPCRDAGKNISYLSDVDFEGDPRIVDSVVDMGADEFHRHLYHVGPVVAGSTMRVNVVGDPRASVMMAVSMYVQDPPQSTMYGDLYLDWPVIQGSFGAIPSNGILKKTIAVPYFWLPGEQWPIQALVGPRGNPDSRLTNLHVLAVE